MAYQQTDRDKAWAILLNMADQFDILQNIKPDRREAFIKHVKEFIDWDMSNEFTVEFSNDYGKVKKRPKHQ